jgi:hypothetical protein
MSSAPRAAAARAWIRAALTENLGYKLLSITLSLVIWAWLQSEQVIERRARATVDWQMPTGLTPVDEAPRVVFVTVSGPQGRVRALERRKLRYSIDLSEAEAGPVQVDLKDRPLAELPDGLEVVQLAPPVIELTLEKRLRRRVRVKPSIVGDPAEGWTVVEVLVEPPTVEIEGPQSLMRTATEVATDVIDLSGARAERSVDAALALNPRTLKPTEHEKVRVTVKLAPILGERTFDEVPVVARAPGWTVSPATARVRVKGPERAVARMKDRQITVTVDLPADPPGGDSVRLRWKRGEAGEIQLALGAGSEDIDVLDVDPSTFTLTRAPATSP